MSEPPTPREPPTEGGVWPTSGALITLSERLIRVLPPAFLLLVLMNIAFLGVIAWVVDHNLDARNAMLTRIIDRCIQDPAARP
jgi:hypothetical protein